MKIDCFRCREEGTTRAGTTDVAPHGWGSYQHRGVPFYLCPRCETEFGREAPYPRNEAWNVECERCGSAFPDRVNEPATFRQWGRAFPDDSGSGVCLNCDARHPRIERLRIRGFRSLADVDFFPRPDASALIGANGSGKSNFVKFFNMLSWMLKARRLQEFVGREGGADDQLHGGNETTSRLDAEVSIRTHTGRNDYRFTLAYAHPDELLFTEEAFRYSRDDIDDSAPWHHLGSGYREARIVEAGHPGAAPQAPGVPPQTARTVTYLLRDCAAYQFHDTGSTSSFKKSWDATDHARLRTDGGNLPAILYGLERDDLHRYEGICRHIRRVLPGFDRFQLDEQYGKVALRWRSTHTDKTYGAHLTSDGSLRFFALATLLNLPAEKLPSVVVLDEPELGLHPKAIALVGDMIQALARSRQVIVATQSPLLVDTFELDQVFVLEIRDGRTEFNSQETDYLREWLDEFSVGELWQKNLLGGRP